jgi:predicted metal-dependent hydrolase
MQEIQILDKTFNFIIKRSSRRSLSMKFLSSDELQVNSPRFMPDFLIKQFIHKNTTWIEKHVEFMQKQTQDSFFPTFEDNSEIPFFGEKIPLKITTDERAKIPRLYFPKNTFHAVVHPDITQKQRKKQLNKLFRDWFMDHTKEKIHERVENYAQKMNARYKNIRIKDVKGHWGSCSSKKNLNFNYRIAMLPNEAIDYIVVHELCHLTEMNHSTRFWTLVEEWIPDHKKIRAELKKRSISLE